MENKDFGRAIENVKEIIAELENTKDIDKAIKLHKICEQELEKIIENINESTQKIEEYTGLTI